MFILKMAPINLNNIIDERENEMIKNCFYSIII